MQRTFPGISYQTGIAIPSRILIVDTFLSWSSNIFVTHEARLGILLSVTQYEGPVESATLDKNVNKRRRYIAEPVPV